MARAESFDVIVTGGGSAGLAAALRASREGARTLLIEREASLGGMGTLALVHTFCGLFHPDVAAGPQWLNPGIPEEIGREMLRRTGQTTPDLLGRVFVLRQHPSILAVLADELCGREPQLTRWSGAEVAAVSHAGTQWCLAVSSREGSRKACSKSLVDASGDAVIGRLLGAQYCQTAPAERLYRPAFICSLHGVTGTLEDADRLELASLIVRAVKGGQLPRAALGAAFRNSPFAHEVFLTIDLEAGKGEWDPLDPAKRSAMESEGRATALALWSFLKANHREFKKVAPPSFPAQAGVRESVRWKGDHILTGSDLIKGRRFDQEAALAGWPLERRESAQGPKFQYFERAVPAGIPLDSLRNSSVPGVFFAGRCISCDHDALASVRVMGTCLATGQGAGRLAAEFTR